MSKHFTSKPKSGGWALSDVVDIVRHGASLIRRLPCPECREGGDRRW
jgi:hypothetical protein